ncbi:flagellar motor switch protein FliM [bacterium]|nr:flagellar motor switch protein FliM [bacterium]MBU1637498.1 flagellar motor switch protein FliM [bacterium]
MSKILTQDEIDALLRNVSATETVQVEEEAPKRPIHLYDFKHPDRISKDQLRALRTIHDAFARSFGTYLSGSLRTLVDINLLSIDQAAYSEYMLSLSVPSCIYIVSSAKLKGSVILEISTEFGLMVVDRLLGGTEARINTVRELTVIEQSIMSRVVDSALSTLSEAWRNVYDLGVYVESFESNPQFVQIAPASETAAVISFDIIIRDTSYPMNICFPYFVLDPLIQNLSNSWANVGTKRLKKREFEELYNRVRLTELPFTAQLGSTKLNMKDYLTLKVGDVIRLDQRTDDPLKVWVDGKVKFWGTPGISKKKRAIRIARRINNLEEIVHE